MAQPGTAVALKTLSPKRRLRRRVLIFSGFCGLASLLVGAIVFLVADVYVARVKALEANKQTLQRVRCDGQVCDMSDINADWEFTGSDYVLDRSTYFFLGTPDSPNGGIPGFPLRYAESEFVRRFETPSTFSGLDGEVWRLYSSVRPVGSRQAAIMVGYAEKASWKMQLPTSTDSVDAALRQQLEKIASSLRAGDGGIEFADHARRRIAADGYLVIDIATNKLLYGGYDLPMYFPRSQALLREGTITLLLLSALIMTAGVALGYWSGMTFLRKYLLLTVSSPHSPPEALRSGEGLTVEFKRSISFGAPTSVDRVLETIAAFANTGDGTIFIGIEDNGSIHGLKLEGPKGRDALKERIHQAVRHKIRPAPLIQVDFVDIEGCTVCRVFVPRGEQPLHVIDGVTYMRDGPADIKAPPERILKLIEEYA